MTAEEAYSDEDEELLAQMREDFLGECQEFLDQISLNLTKLEEHPDDEEVVNEIFRAAHTIKGSASFVGLEEIREVAHKMEDVFGVIREGKLAVSARVIDLMYQGLNMLTALKDKAIARDTTATDIAPLVAELVKAAEPGKPAEPAPKKVGKKTAKKKTSKAEAKEAAKEVAVEPTGEPTEIPKKPTKEPVKPHILEESIKVKTEKLDELMNLISELITAKNRLNELADESMDENLKTVASQINRTTNDMYSGVMKIRMVPLERLFNKFPGVVRNLARDLRREVEFIIEGQETEMDKTVIEQLYDPLVHLLRNAIDHGIEDPATRRRLNKPERGVIKLGAYHQHNNVFITITDDGKGMNPEDLKQAAVRKGLLTTEEAATLSPEQATQLIFRPGFSTKEVVSEISGRGVGMDVVGENIQKLRGLVEVKTEINKGTTFTIQLPLTLAILQALLVNANGVRYAVPIDLVVETMTLRKEDIKQMENRDVVFFRDQALQLKSLGEMLLAKTDAIGETGSVRSKLAYGEAATAVVLELAEKRTALVVDYLFGKQDVVVKPLGRYLGRVRGVEGGTILADGTVTLVLDMAELAA